MLRIARRQSWQSLHASIHRNRPGRESRCRDSRDSASTIGMRIQASGTVQAWFDSPGMIGEDVELLGASVFSEVDAFDELESNVGNAEF